jgi:beta-lactamase class C
LSNRTHASLAAAALTFTLAGLSPTDATERDEAARVRRIVDEAMRPVVERHGIPGLAVALTVDGRRHFFEYGLASKDPEAPVTRDTLFELGSISKTFTATLAAYAEGEGRLSLRDGVGRHVPELKGSALGGVRLVDLATHTAGGFPLQVPDAVKDGDQLMAYFRAWTPQAPAGTSRVYANPSIGLLGMASARAMGEGFEALMERRLFPELGLRRTYVAVPEGEMRAYAWGYNREGKPVRVNPGQLASEAYGVKSNAVDMARFLEVNMGVGQVPPKVARAVAATHLGHYRAEGVTQALIWEWYPLPVEPDRLVAGNSLNLRAVHATAVEPPARPGGDVLVNKTGSTNGFGAYVAFIPGKRLGIVMLANRNYPNEARVRAAHRVLSRLAE